MNRKIIFDRYGGPEVLRTETAVASTPAVGEVKVRIKAAGVQPFDCMFRAGMTHKTLPAHFPQQIGNEFAGIVEDVGEGVEWPKAGDEVLGWVQQAAYADYVIVKPDQIVAKPANAPWAEAAVLTASGQTASTAIAELGVHGSDTILIHGASGGVGSFAVQLAVLAGAKVIGTASESNHSYLRSLGAVPVAYGLGLAARIPELVPEGVTAALVAAGGEEAISASLALVPDRKRIGILPRLDMVAARGLRALTTHRSVDRLRELVFLHSTGALRVTLQRSYDLEDAEAAHREQETGHVRGKLVLLT